MRPLTAASVLAGHTQAMLKTELKAASAPAGRSRAKPPECSLGCVLVAEIADFKGLVLVPLSGLKRPPPNFPLIVQKGLADPAATARTGFNGQVFRRVPLCSSICRPMLRQTPRVEQQAYERKPRSRITL